MDDHYHSVNGAVQESRHVFIEAGLHHQAKKNITVFEIGFGTGLNAFLTLLDAEENNRSVNYYSIELYPLGAELVRALNYGKGTSDGFCGSAAQTARCGKAGSPPTAARRK